MLYDIHLALTYDYDAPVHGGRHLIRVMPGSIPKSQRVIAAGLSIDPLPDEQTSFFDFFGNASTAVRLLQPHEQLKICLSARVSVEERKAPKDRSPSVAAMAEHLTRFWSVQSDSPHHFVSNSPRVQVSPAIATYAATVSQGQPSVLSAANALCLAINKDFIYDGEATTVETKTEDAFALRRGVCQDFAHIMIAGLRGLGIPAGYVSGFLRTLPPPGEPRLEGADAMHAWVRVWCGAAMGWIEFDPTNARMAGTDHISIGFGRDYSDISPVIGVLRTHGSHDAKQFVDVLPVEQG